MIASHPKKDDSHAARRQRWACDRCGEKPLSEEIDLYFATGLCSWCSHLLAEDDDQAVGRMRQLDPSLRRG
jgi:late competence protein required for DNA uptake (superfamily II DNA/RNA helicase)